MAAEFVVSALLPVVIDKLVSETSKTIARYKGIGAEIKKWERWLKQIQEELTDASEIEIRHDSVKQWLNDLQHLAYDVDDLLDGWVTEGMDPEFTHQYHSTSKVITKLIPTCCTNFSRNNKMLQELDSINARFKDLVNQKNEIGLKGEGKSGLKVEGGDPKPKNTNGRSQTSSVVDPSRIVGREDERKELVQQLLEDGPSDQKYSIVPIVGMGGVGKTTVAKLLYNEEEQVCAHFELMAWVSVSDEFDSFAISKVIYENVSRENKTFSNLNLVQVELVNQLRGKRILLVLDDIRRVSDREWENLVEPFYVCAPGSKIIITTRNEDLLTRLGCKDLIRLQSLSHNNAMFLFARHALGADNFDSCSSLKPHGEAIVEKCKGLPLALISLGTLLKTKEDEDSWRGVANSKIWELEDGGGILPALRISYLDLEACLKRLFVYCSLFPKGFLFDKEELVRLWMAEGFLALSTPSDPTKESLGYTCFDKLLSRSFFQQSSDNKFVMHDMVNDLATSVAGEFFLRFDNETENGKKEETWKQHRHMSFVSERYVTSKKFKTFEKAERLRTLLATYVGVKLSYSSFFLSDKIFAEVLPKLPLLRVLSLSNFAISKVPESVGTLRHLRYLNLSRTAITHLPESVCSLYNLQTLILSGCVGLTKLPNSFIKLKNLLHFDISGTSELLKMPLGIGEMKSIQTLTKIIIEGENGFGIAELKNLENLCRKVSIVGLEKVQDGKHAREANFSQKKLSELELEWSSDSLDKGTVKEVLNELKPHSDKLIQLKIKSYCGIEFPIWVGDPTFLLLKHVSILNCSNCTSLPPLGQLPSLKKLFIGGLYNVKVVGMEFFGAGPAFPLLEILSFNGMSGWKKWTTNSEAVFPRLQELHIKDCEELIEVSLEALPPLNVLAIRGCDSGVLRILVQVAKAVIKLEVISISGLSDVVWRDVMEHLREVEKLIIISCDELRYLWESKAVASKVLVKLRYLEVSSCNSLMSLGEKDEEKEDDNQRSNLLLTSLRFLHVSNCKNLECCKCPDSIETLRVFFCSSVTTISLASGGGQNLKSFYVDNCKKLLETEWVGQKISSSNNRIEEVSIHTLPNLKSVIELSYFVHLTELLIVDCKNLESFPDNELAKRISLKNMKIYNCPRMDACFPRGVWPPNLNRLQIGKLKKPISKWGTQNFPTSLENLLINGDEEDGVSSCHYFSDLLPSSLTNLVISEFKELESVSEELQHLTSLKHLYFYKCPNLKKLSSYPQHLERLELLICRNVMDLPEDLLPSLLSLEIRGCPKLKERCSEGGSYHYNISYIPHKLIR